MADRTIDPCWRGCAELASSGEYHYQRAVMGKSHEEAAVLARRAYDRYVPLFSKSIAQRLLEIRKPNAA